LVASPALPVAPYTVPSDGEGGVPLSQHEHGESLRVVSGIAVSFDGQTSRYLPLPPLLPSRSAAWHQPSSDCADHDGQANGGGSRVEP
ncbi:unnamed protein product, partial [Ectocarpus sp. 13 AM-2016]